MSMFDTIKSWILQPAVPLVDFPVGATDVALNQEPLEAHRHYVRLRLARMFLRYESTWFQNWFPAVQSFVRFQFGDGTVEIPNVADAKRLKLEPTSGADLIVKNVPLTPTMPFRGGLMEVSASLLAIKGANGLQNFIGVLAGFADILQAPQLSASLKIASPLASGLQVLLNSAFDHLHLGYFNSFAAGELRDGYIAILHLPAKDCDKSKFSVRGDELYITADGGKSEPFTQCDYMLLRTEVFDTRDDFEALTFIAQPWSEVLEAVAAQGPEWEKLASARFRVLLLRLNQAAELTRADRVRIGKELLAQFQQMKEQFSISGAVGRDFLPDLSEIARRAVPAASAVNEREQTVEELLADT